MKPFTVEGSEIGVTECGECLCIDRIYSYDINNERHKVHFPVVS